MIKKNIKAAKSGGKKQTAGAPAGNKNAEGHGRPTVYSSELANAFLKKMSEGLSWRAAAAELNIAASTFYKWAKEREDFAEIAELAKGKRGAFLERQLLAEESTAKARSLALLLRNADPSYCDKIGLEHSGEIDHAIVAPIQITYVDAAADTPDVLKKIAAGAFEENKSN